MKYDAYVEFFTKNLIDNGVDKAEAFKLAANWDRNIPVDLKKLAEAVKACHRVKRS